MPAVVAVLLYRRVPWYTIFWFGLSPVVHILIWMAGLRLMGHASDPLAVWSVILSSMTSLHGLGQYDNPLASSWYTWPALYHPIVVKPSSSGTTSRYASSSRQSGVLVPPALLVIGLPVARGLTALRTGWRLIGRLSSTPRSPRRSWCLPRGGRLYSPYCWFPWASTRSSITTCRPMLRHYSVGRGLAKLERRWPHAVLVFVALSILVALYFVPVWGDSRSLCQRPTAA